MITSRSVPGGRCGRARSVAARSRGRGGPCRSTAGSRAGRSGRVQRDAGEHLGEQRVVRTRHHRVGVGDDEDVGAAAVVLERPAHRLRSVPGVDVAPQVPSPQLGSASKDGNCGVVLGVHDVAEPQPDHRQVGVPPAELARQLLLEGLDQRVGAVRAWAGTPRRPGRRAVARRRAGRAPSRWRPRRSCGRRRGSPRCRRCRTR